MLTKEKNESIVTKHKEQGRFGRKSEALFSLHSGFSGGADLKVRMRQKDLRRKTKQKVTDHAMARFPTGKAPFF